MSQATFCGVLAGMAPDLDILIRSSSDPLLFLEYHRQFTHSLVFIPVGAAICAAVFHFAVGRRWGWAPKATFLFSLLGYGTHALLDACTSYGTMLLWPFSDMRIAWNNVSIIDPLVTVPLLFAVILAWRNKGRVYARAGLICVLGYLFMGVVAREQAAKHAEALAARRGHAPVRLEVKPSFANLIVWKSVYEADGHYYVDAIRLGVWGDAHTYEGTSVRKLDLRRDFPWLAPGSQQARDIKRFRWFSNDFLAVDPNHPERIGDVRYSMLPHEVRPLWAIELDRDAGPDDPIRFRTERNSGRASASTLWRMLQGQPLR